MELVQIADEEEEISNTADFNVRSDVRSGRREEFTLRKESLQDTAGHIESERNVYVVNSREVSVVNLPAHKISSRRETKEEREIASYGSEEVLKSPVESEVRQAVDIIIKKQF